MHNVELPPPPEKFMRTPITLMSLFSKNPNRTYRDTATSHSSAMTSSYLCCDERVTLVHFPQPVQHLGQFRWIDRLDSNLDNRVSAKP